MKNYHSVKLYLVLFFIAIISGHASLSWAKTFSADTLINESNQLDGKSVDFQGEVIGDIMRHDKYCWINVNDGTQAIGVYCTAEMTRSIKFVGDYKHTGDIIKVRGKFHKACQQHGGELDIHAQQVRIIKTGSLRNYPLTISKIYFALSLIFCSVLTLGLFIYRKKTFS